MTFFVAFLDHEGGSASQQVGGKLIILRIWKKLSQPKSVQFWIPMGMPSWQVQKNLGVCLALWRLGGCLCLQKVGFLKVPFFTLKSGFLAILTPLLLYQNFSGYISFRCLETFRALQIGQNQGLLILGTDILLEICCFGY